VTANPSAIVAEARSWILTPYHAGAGIKGVGVDCAQLLRRVYVDIGAIPEMNPPPYAIDEFLHTREEIYLKWILPHFREVAEPEAGGLVMFKMGRIYAHGGVVSTLEPFAIFHAWSPKGGVVEDELRHNGELTKPERAPRYFVV
jgi:cell wall-associated NlpC family hydrolase